MSCQASSNCYNLGDKCWICRFESSSLENWYAPIDRTIKHPALVAEKEERKLASKAAKKEKKDSKDKDKSRLVKRAAKVEEKVKKTLNSGRAYRDNDLKTEDISIDVKLQSNNKNPVINVDEFTKCQNDALRASKKHGCLIIENKDGKRFVVMSEELFGELI